MIHLKTYSSAPRKEYETKAASDALARSLALPPKPQIIGSLSIFIHRAERGLFLSVPSVSCMMTCRLPTNEAFFLRNVGRPAISTELMCIFLSARRCIGSFAFGNLARWERARPRQEWPGKRKRTSRPSVRPTDHRGFRMSSRNLLQKGKRRSRISRLDPD